MSAGGEAAVVRRFLEDAGVVRGDVPAVVMSELRAYVRGRISGSSV